VGQLEKGQAVNFTVDAYPYRTFHGTVEQVRNAPNTVQNVVTYDVVISVGNDDLKLKPGMTANLGVVIAQRENVLKIPNAALRYKPADAVKPETALAHNTSGARPSPGMPRQKHEAPKTVYLLPEGAEKPQPAQVRLGISDGISTEVLDGVKENDPLVTGVESGTTAAGGSATGGGMPGFGGGGHRPF
jgi:HlyD family secretion protein